MLKKNVRILVAHQREADALGLPCEIIGIGATDLPETTENDILVNIGYCGAYQIPVGILVEPRTVNSGDGWEPLQTAFRCIHAPCYTAEEFVTEPYSQMPAIYDMELGKVMKLPHKELFALKIVSDNLDESACEAFESKEAWDYAKRLLQERGLIC